MLKIELAITYMDGRETTVVARPHTWVAFEREFNTSIGDLGTQQKAEHLYWLAWHAAKPGVEFDSWLESVDAIDVAVDELDPTRPAAPAT